MSTVTSSTRLLRPIETASARHFLDDGPFVSPRERADGVQVEKKATEVNERRHHRPDAGGGRRGSLDGPEVFGYVGLVVPLVVVSRLNWRAAPPHAAIISGSFVVIVAAYSS